MSRPGELGNVAVPVGCPRIWRRKRIEVQEEEWLVLGPQLSGRTERLLCGGLRGSEMPLSKSLFSGLIGGASSPVILGASTVFSLAPNPLFSVTEATQSQMSAFCGISDR